MARLHNSRIQNTKDANKARQEFVRPTIRKIKDLISSANKKTKIFVLCMFFFNIISMVCIGIFTTGIPQSILFVVLSLLNIVIAVVFNVWAKHGLKTFAQTALIFFLAITLVSTFFLIYGKLNIGNAMAIKDEIQAAKDGSIKILSTDIAEIYVNMDDMKVYSITDIADQKYVNSNHITPADKSEYYFLYNVGVQMESPDSQFSDVYIYPPTPHTVTGYEYLLEFKYNGTLYITKIFLPGYVDMTKNVSSIMFVLTYANTEEKYYVVNRLDNYLLFQSDYSSFATPFENVKYTSDQEYFYVRYNRYLEQYMESDDYEKLDEKNVRFAKTLLTMSTTISKINFFWIGEEVNGQFIASLPVMEIVYDNGTCDIAIIKDISPESLQSAVT